MKPILYVALIFTAAFVSFSEKLDAQSPDWLWLKSIGGHENDGARSIAVDPESGDVFTTGFFSGTVDFDPGGRIFNLTATGASDIFISKSNHAGHFVWALALGVKGFANVVSISLDPVGSGDIYITGSFHGIVDFGPEGEAFKLSSSGDSDIFIAKFDGFGQFIWAKAIGGPDAVYVLSMAIDPAGSGDVYITGYFQGTINLNPGIRNLRLTSNGDTDIFIAKLEGEGKLVWAVGFGGPGSDVSRSIALDPSGSGDVYITGWFKGKVDFDPGPDEFHLTSIGRFDIFISKIDGSGNFVWAKELGGIGVKDGSGSSIAIDPGSGDIYTTGYFEGITDFDPGIGKCTLASNGLRDIFISKLDSDGNFIWARAMGGIGQDIGSSIKVDPSGNGDVYIIGNFHTSVDFDPGPDEFILSSIGSYDLFISKLDGSGNFLWAKTIGSERTASGALALDASGHAYIAGSFDGPGIMFGSVTLSNTGAHDIFVAKLDVTNPKPEENIISTPITIYPNPASNELYLEVEGDEFFHLDVRIFNNIGDVVYSGTDQYPVKKKFIDISSLTAGIYFMETNINGIRVVNKIVKEYSGFRF